MKKTGFIVPVLIIFLMNIGLARTTQETNKDQKNGKNTAWWLNPYIIKELKLTPKQKNEIKKLNNESDKTTKILLDLKIKRNELNKAMAEIIIDENTVRGLIDEIGKLQSKMYKTGMLIKLKAIKILTDEQREQLKKTAIHKSTPLKKKTIRSPLSMTDEEKDKQ